MHASASRSRSSGTASIAGWLLAIAVLGGCAATGAPPRPAPLLHLVYFHLVEPADADALLADCDEMLAAIPSVTSYAAGRHFDVGRANVDGDYDLALLVGFDDAAGYEAYLVHPLHVELVDRWRDRFERLVIHDVADPTP